MVYIDQPQRQQRRQSVRLLEATELRNGRYYIRCKTRVGPALGQARQNRAKSVGRFNRASKWYSIWSQALAALFYVISGSWNIDFPDAPQHEFNPVEKRGGSA